MPRSGVKPQTQNLKPEGNLKLQSSTYEERFDSICSLVIGASLGFGYWDLGFTPAPIAEIFTVCIILHGQGGSARREKDRAVADRD
jgi:hypothetical protein